MSAIEAIILGLVQGLTEFLPISSSGHLRIVPALVGWEDPGAGFTAVIQLGTMAAVLLYFRRDLWGIARAFLRELRVPFRQRSHQANLGWFIVLGTIPIAIFGFAFQDQIESGARSLYLIGSMLILFSFVMLFAERVGKRQREMEDLERPRRHGDRLRPGPGAGPRRLALGGDHLGRVDPGIRPGRRGPLLVRALGARGRAERPLPAARHRRRRRGRPSRRPRSRHWWHSSPATPRSPGCSVTSRSTHSASSSPTGSRSGCW